MPKTNAVARELENLSVRVGTLEKGMVAVNQSQKRIEHSLIDSKGKVKGAAFVASGLIAIVGGAIGYFSR